MALPSSLETAATSLNLGDAAFAPFWPDRLTGDNGPFNPFTRGQPLVDPGSKLGAGRSDTMSARCRPPSPSPSCEPPTSVGDLPGAASPSPATRTTSATLLADVNGLRRSVGFRIPEARLSCVTGIGSALWDRLFDAAAPGRAAPSCPSSPATGTSR